MRKLESKKLKKKMKVTCVVNIWMTPVVHDKNANSTAKCHMQNSANYNAARNIQWKKGTTFLWRKKENQPQGPGGFHENTDRLLTRDDVELHDFCIRFIKGKNWNNNIKNKGTQEVLIAIFKCTQLSAQPCIKWKSLHCKRILHHQSKRIWKSPSSKARTCTNSVSKQAAGEPLWLDFWRAYEIEHLFPKLMNGKHAKPNGKLYKNPKKFICT